MPSTCELESVREMAGRRPQGAPRRLWPTPSSSPTRWRPSPTGRWRFLADAGTVLDASLDYEQTLANTARLAVPEVADYCVVVLVADDSTIRWAHCAHRDPRKGQVLEALREHATLGYEPGHPVLVALRTGEPQLVPHVGHQLDGWWKPAHLAAVRELSPTSCVAVPLIARGRTLGALLFAVTAQSGRRYGRRDLDLACEVGRRAATAIDHAVLYRAAERAAAARDELMAVVAHDLKNPLNIVKLSLLRLLDAFPDGAEHAKEREGLGMVLRAADRMERLIHDVLELSSADAGQLRIRPVPTPAQELVIEAVDAHRTLAAAQRIRLEASRDGDLPRVTADRDRIAQVFSNLVGNALKFTPAGGQVTLAASRTDGSVCFVVQDTGPGIAPEDRPHLFDRFSHAARKARSGTGLGLSIAKAIVEGHGGTIGVDSVPGRGSRFHFSLPVAPNPIVVSPHPPDGEAKNHAIV